jgi:hypothetical protein
MSDRLLAEFGKVAPAQRGDKRMRFTSSDQALSWSKDLVDPDQLKQQGWELLGPWTKDGTTGEFTQKDFYDSVVEELKSDDGTAFIITSAVLGISVARKPVELSPGFVEPGQQSALYGLLRVMDIEVSGPATYVMPAAVRLDS